MTERGKQTLFRSSGRSVVTTLAFIRQAALKTSFRMRNRVVITGEKHCAEDSKEGKIHFSIKRTPEMEK